VWTIDRRAHDWFTTSSGDANPIHADPVAARRLLGGRMLVHGANLLLRTLDQVAGAGLITAVPERIAVVFRAGVAPDDPLVTRATHRDDATLAITVADGTALERTVATIDVVAGVGGRPSPFVGARQLATDRPTIARALDLLDLAGEVGRDQPAFVPEIDPAQLEAHFPALVALLGARPVASIAAISCVIGMLTPGRSSMSSAYDIRDLAGVHTDDTTHDTTHGTTDTGDVRVRHTLDHVDLRLRRVRLTVRGPGCTAAVTAFVPPEPVDQATVLAGAPPPTPTRVRGLAGARGGRQPGPR
jgi:acyl dehydratase